MSDCLVVMYHYVRDLENSRYPAIKGLSLENFRRQLDFLQKTRNMVSAEDLRLCLEEGRSLPEKACLLSFDDGYIEHYTEVFPELAKRGLSGCFYPPVRAVARGHVLAVNKIHLLLASLGYENIDMLLARLRELYEREDNGGIGSWQELEASHAKAGRFDPAEVIFFKRLLQFALPAPMREKILAVLFDEYMDATEGVLAREMYVSEDMLRVMARAGMHIGSHASSHAWLDTLPAREQEEEIDKSLEMLARIHGRPDFYWSIAYPFGRFNDDTLEICASRGCAFGLTTKMDMAKVEDRSRLIMGRHDTNDIFGMEKK